MRYSYIGSVSKGETSTRETMYKISVDFQNCDGNRVCNRTILSVIHTYYKGSQNNIYFILIVEIKYSGVG